jgi:outer membrane receptor protein involved in Fe transport
MRNIRSIPTSAIVLFVLSWGAPIAMAQPMTRFDLPSQPLADSLRSVGSQTNTNILFDPPLVAGRTAPALKAELTVDQALTRLLAGTGIKHEFLNETTVMLSGGSPQAGFPEALEEIVVTAEKRESTVQRTPVSITAITGQEIRNHGLITLNDVMAEVPGVASVATEPTQTVFIIRGLSSGGGESPTVGFYLNDVPLTPPAQSENGKFEIDPNLYDLARVEVLRGPQGTLYGAGSMGGTIKLVTNPPDPSGIYGSAETTVSGTDGGGINYGQNAMLNLPLWSDRAALRVVGSGSHTSGWIDRDVVPDFPLPSHPVTGFYGSVRGNVAAAPVAKSYHNVNDEDLTGGRVTLLIKPIDDLTITPSVFYQRITTGGANTFDAPPGALVHFQPFDVSEPLSDKFTVSSLDVKYGFHAAELSSTTAYWTRNFSYTQDASESTQSVLGLSEFSSANELGVGRATAKADGSLRQFSQELRLTSRGDGALQWLIGGYYGHYHFVAHDESDIPGLATLYGGALGSSVFFNVTSPFDIKQKAAFGNVSYALTSQLKLTAGVRHFSYGSTAASTNFGVAVGSLTPILQSGTAAASGNNPMFNLAYSPTADLMVYATAAKGFREGGANYPVPTAGQVGAVCLADLNGLGRTASPLQFGPDSVWSYELGEKSSWLDHRLIVNASAYYVRWSKVQQPINLACGYGFTDNTADAAVKGGEVEAAVKLTANLDLHQSVGYTHAAFTNDSPGAGIIAGQPLLLVPHWTISTSLDYRHSLPMAGQSIQASLTNSYVSSMYDFVFAPAEVPARNLVNARVGWIGAKMSLALFANNLLNRRLILANASNVSSSIPSYTREASNQPLTVGLDFNVNF